MMDDDQPTAHEIRQVMAIVACRTDLEAEAATIRNPLERSLTVATIRANTWNTLRTQHQRHGSLSGAIRAANLREAQQHRRGDSHDAGCS